MVNKYRKSINFGRLLPLFFVLLLTVFMLTGCVSKTESPNIASGNNSFSEQTELIEDKVSQTEASSDDKDKPESELLLDEDSIYTTKEDVSLYIHLYGELPSNFITKKQAQELGWSGGSLEQYAPGKCIGGNFFGNYEGLLPAKDGRVYTECDIDTLVATKRQ